MNNNLQAIRHNTASLVPVLRPQYLEVVRENIEVEVNSGSNSKTHKTPSF